MSDQKAKLAFEIIARENSRMLTAYLRTLINDESLVDADECSPRKLIAHDNLKVFGDF